MKLTRQRTFTGSDENDLDFAIFLWLYNKEYNNHHADRDYYRVAEVVSVRTGVLPANEPK